MAFGGTEAFRLYGTVGVDPKPAMQGLDQLSGHVQKSGGIIQTAMGTALGFMGGQAMTSIIGQGVGFLKGAAIDYNASMEQASIGFTTLLGSAEKAQSFIADLQSFAAKTPFDFPGLQQSANQMLAMGFSSDEIIPKLTAVGDAVAALGGTPEMVGRATYALGQMKSAGRVTAQDMMQLTSMGIPAWNLLAESIGKSVPETRKLAEQGLIPADQAIEAITSGIEKGDMGGMMAAQSKTFVGAMSNISDTVNQAAGKAMAPFFDMVSKGAQALAEWMGSAQGAAFFQGISDGVGAVIGGVRTLIDLVAQVVGVFTGAQGAAANLTTTVGTALQGLVAQAGPILAQLGEAFATWVADAVPKMLAALGDLVLAMSDWVMAQVPVLAGQLVAWAGAFVDWIGPQIPVFLDALLDFVESGVEWIVSTGVPSFVKGMLTMAQELVKWVGPQVPVLLGKLGGLMVSVVGWIVTEGIPRLVNAAAKLAGGLVSGFIDLLMGTGGQPGLVANWATFVTRDLVPGLLGLGGQLATAGLDLAVSLGKSFANGLAGLIEGGLNAVIRALNTFQVHFGGFDIPGVGTVGKLDWNGLGLPPITLPRFARGAWDLPRDMFAQVHQGEMIVPANLAESMRSALMGGGVGGLGAGQGRVLIVNGLTVTVTGPTLDPYGDFATRLAAALIPGLQRELARQGVNL